MGKGAVLDEAFLQAIGQSEQIFTLKGPVVHGQHPRLHEPMVLLSLREMSEPVWVERRYLFDNQVSLRSQWGDGERLLLWIVRQMRPDPLDPAAGMITIILARECFLLNDWREFQRFKTFVKSMRIVDAQARQWLEDHHQELAAMAATQDGVERILTNLSKISDLPDLEGATPGNKADALERIAKTYAADLAQVRKAVNLPAQLMARDHQDRFTLFRLFSHVEDPAGPSSLLRFLSATAQASGDVTAIEHTRQISNGRDLARAFASLRSALRRPGA